MIVASLRERLAQIPGAREVLPEVWHLPGERSPQRLAAGSLLLLGAQTLLVDAGMRDDVASALRSSGLAARLHVTHMHLDHRLHQSWFDPLPATCPTVEAAAFADWDVWLGMSGFPPEFAASLHAWRTANFAVEVRPDMIACDPDTDLNPGGAAALLLMLPGHTAGHSGLWWPDHRAMFVTDYDMEKFGPWYGNPTSSLDDYVATLRGLVARSDVDLFITGHSRAELDAATFRVEAERYLRMIEERSARIHAALSAEGPLARDALVGRRIFYPSSALKGNPLLVCFEQRMLDLHLEALARDGLAVRAPDGRWLGS